MDRVLLYFSLKYNGNWKKIYEALQRKERIGEDDLDLVESRITCNYLTIVNPIYPTKLKDSYQPPFVIFYQGDIDLLVNYYKIIGLIDDEQLSDYSQQQKNKMLESLAKEHKTVATLKKINLEFHQKLNQIIISDHMKGIIFQPNCLIISESYQISDNFKKDHLIFAVANFILVSQLSTNNLLFETLKIVVGATKEIFVIPQKNGVSNLVNNWLIKQGAKLAEHSSDILNDF